MKYISQALKQCPFCGDESKSEDSFYSEIHAREPQEGDTIKFTCCGVIGIIVPDGIERVK